jgi:ABC-type bacteriocin/lantibiotic exporter with double-glycine peptidase domain
MKEILLFYSILSHENKQLVWSYIFFIQISAIAEIFSIGAFLPFIGMLAGTNKYNILLPNFFNISDLNLIQQKEFFLVIFTSSVLFSTFLRFFLIKLKFKINFSIGNQISNQIYKNYVSKSYQDFISIKSSNQISSLQKVDDIVNVVDTILQATASILISFLIFLTLLIFVETKIILVVLLVALIFIIFGILAFSTLSKNSEKVKQNYTSRIRQLQKTAGLFRYIVIENLQKIFFNQYNSIDKDLRSALASNQLLQSAPRFFAEGLGIVSIASILFFLVKIDGFTSAIPLIGLIVICFQKLVPHLQVIYYGWAQYAGAIFLLNDVISELNKDKNKNTDSHQFNKLNFKKSIYLKGISFSYGRKKILENVNLEITRGSSIGIIGRSGSGKSTLVDIITSLLDPSEGELYIDDVIINTPKKKGQWRKNISLIPQDIYMINGSFLDNIHLGYGKPILKRIIRASRAAMIHDEITLRKEKYHSQVEEFGSNLSGGQRQRIAIARALYKNGDLLIFDESTNSLDKATEAQIIKNIEGLFNKKTIIYISHNAKNLENFSYIYEVKNKKLIKLRG